MKNIMTLIMLLCMASLTACGGGGSDNSSQVQTQQTQITTLQTQLADVQTQLTAAQAQSQADSAGIATAIASLTQTQSSLNQLAGQTAPTNSASAQQRAAALTTASNQVLVLQSLADSLTATGQSVTTAYNTAQARVTSLTTQLNTATAQVATLTTQLSAANSQVATLTAQLAASQSSNSDLTSQLAAANAQVTSLTSQLATANAQVTTLTGQITTLNSTVASLQSQLNSANSTIATRDATIASLNTTITTLNATIANMVATPVPMSVSALTAAVFTNITVTATFPVSQAGQTATFSTTGGSLTAGSVTIAGGGTATTTFSSATTGTFNIYAVQGLYAGGVVVTITTPTYSISGKITHYSVGQSGVSGVIVVLTGAATGAAVTDASGNYSFDGLQNGSYTVAPWTDNYIFPASTLSVTITNANATGNNFCSRWRDNNNGTITDMTTGLVWLKDANCTQSAGGIAMTNGKLRWGDAQTWAAGLASGTCGLTDSSVAGNWRVPTVDEFLAIVSGRQAVSCGTPMAFSAIQSYGYWSSNASGSTGASAFIVGTTGGGGSVFINRDMFFYVWPVRSVQ